MKRKQRVHAETNNDDQTSINLLMTRRKTPSFNPRI